MKYFIDTEFIEGTQMKRFMGMNVGKTKPTIDLISIGIVSEDGREYYAISKDFNLKEAWNRYDIKQYYGDMRNQCPNGYREYWIRENILKPIYKELIDKELNEDFLAYLEYSFSYSSMKYLINKYGKTNKQIAEEIKDFVYEPYMLTHQMLFSNDWCPKDIEFYGYYSAYDYVILCWLFNKLINLPKGFPSYTIDLKQVMDEKAPMGRYMPKNSTSGFLIKEHQKYPKQINEHNSLSDAKWNKQLYEFLNTI